MMYRISSRNLLGFRGDMLTATKGVGVFASRVLGYFPQEQLALRTRSGVLVAMQKGAATAYALEALQQRGVPFIRPGVQVYAGMVVGLNKRRDDLEMNVCKVKGLSNVHNATSDIEVPLDAPTILSLEQALDFIEDDELVEVTPQSLRLRKKILDHTSRVRAARTTQSSL